MLAAAANPFSLITRGPLIVRDVDVLVEAAKRATSRSRSPCRRSTREVWRRTEPGTAPPHQRLRALSRLVDAGVRASVGMAPILPGISDRPEQLAEVVRAAREAGACGVWANLLHLKPGTREHFLEGLAARLAGARCPSTSGSTAARLPAQRRGRADARARAASSPASTASATAAACASRRRRRPSS